MQLNEAQEEAVRTVSGPLLILAGAGSGKTRTLTERIVHLLAEGYARPWEILAITFTNKAAEEMRSRVEARLGSVADDMWIMTFHRASLAILRREAEHLGYPPRFSIYDTGDQLAVMRAVVKDLNLSEQYFPPQKLLWQVSRLKSELREPADLRAGSFQEETLREVYSRYQERLRAAGAMDFDDLIARTVELFERFPEVLERYQERFRYVHVDEYQDTNMAQYRWVQLLTLRHMNLAVVGDPDQSIYGWRGADIRNILEFERDFPGARTIVLDRNYRSTQRILTAANAVVRENTMRLEKELWTDGPEGPPLRLVEAEDGREEAELVARTVEALARGGRRLGDMAVLVRTNGQTRPIEEAFLRHDLPYRLIAGVRFYERAEIKDVLAYLRLLVRVEDEVALERALTTPRRGIGEATLEALRADAAARGVPTYEALPHYRGRGEAAVHAFYETMEEERRSTLPLARRIEHLIQVVGLKAMWDELPPAEREARWDNVRAFIEKAREAESEGDDLATFLDRVALLTTADEVGEGRDAVLVLTMHAAKGLEFPVVLIPGMEEGILPHALAGVDGGDVEEERRLCYVALTRAKEELHLFRARRRVGRGGMQPTRPSRFLRAIPAHLFRREAVEEPQGAALETDFAPGDRVLHPTFGLGVVVARSGVGQDAELKVAFEGRGVKDILVRYAALRRG